MVDRSFWWLLGVYAVVLTLLLLILTSLGYSPIELTNIALGMSSLYVSILMVYVASQSVKATKYVGELGIQPLVYAYIRSARAYTEKKGRDHGWLPGVGIFVESIGNGPALNGKIKCTLIGDNQKRSYDMIFNRLIPNQRYTYPSRDEPNLEIKDTDEELVIEIEYDDAIRKHHKEETIKIKLLKKYFERTEGNITV